MTSFESDLIKQQVTMLNKEVTGLRKELHDTQKEMSQILGEFQNVVSSLAAMSASAIDGLSARISKLEQPIQTIVGVTGAHLPSPAEDSGVEL